MEPTKKMFNKNIKYNVERHPERNDLYHLTQKKINENQEEKEEKNYNQASFPLQGNSVPVDPFKKGM